MFQAIRNYFTRIKHIFSGYSTPRCVGLDIASSAIKIVELNPDTLQVRRYNIAGLSKNAVSEGVIHDIDKVSGLIINQWRNLNPDANTIAISIPYNAVMIKQLTTPIIKDLFALDKFILEQLTLELDIEDIDFDYSIIEQTDDKQIVNVVVAKKEKIEEYQAIIQITGLKVAAIDIEPFAIAHLFSILLKRNQLNQQFLLLDLGVTRLRVFIFENTEQLVFNEIVVNYRGLYEDIIRRVDSNINLAEITDIYSYTAQLINNNNLAHDELNNAIITDMHKIIQLIKSNLLIEKKIILSEATPIFLIGGNAVLPSLVNIIGQQFNCSVKLITELMRGENQHIPEADLLRLMTAIALATWGQQLNAN
ncbi:MAG: hypothetical protein RLZZ293_668 [Pseudomonadota bacterium]|jgi:type IV pilus assembly protein PilM